MRVKLAGQRERALEIGRRRATPRSAAASSTAPSGGSAGTWGGFSLSSVALVQSESAGQSIGPSRSLSMPSSQAIAVFCSEGSVAFSQPVSARSTNVSPSLSWPSSHAISALCSEARLESELDGPRVEQQARRVLERSGVRLRPVLEEGVGHGEVVRGDPRRRTLHVRDAHLVDRAEVVLAGRAGAPDVEGLRAGDQRRERVAGTGLLVAAPSAALRMGVRSTAGDDHAGRCCWYSAHA